MHETSLNSIKTFRFHEIANCLLAPLVFTPLDFTPVLDKVSNGVHDRLRALVLQIVSEQDSGRPNRIDVNLREAGLTSLDMVKLVLAIENEFGIMIEPDDMDPENFETLDALERLVCRLTG